MKIEYIKISNILSFKYYPDIKDAPSIPFDEGLNILIGQNGSGKSTALEVINFIFKRVIFVHYNINQDEYGRQNQLEVNQKKQILRRHDTNNHYHGFRLEPNWGNENDRQNIQIRIRLDDIDKRNIDILENNKQYLEKVAGIYSTIAAIDFSYPHDSFLIDITLDKNTQSFTYTADHNDGGFQYLVQYNYYKDLIEICNRELSTKIDALQESFTLIGGYRNYNAFTASVSLTEEPLKQIQKLRNNEFNKSTNASDQQEPPIFNLVRLRIAALHMDGVFTNLNEQEAAQRANEEPFLLSINKKLELVYLKVRIALENKHSWAYSFKFLDLNTNKVLSNINSLSAGQKSIVHLIFESYGRDTLKGGVVIIDEPEIHLHYQFQFEYLRVIEQLNIEQNCQYILVTHSEALISSETIDKVKRFALDSGRNTIIKSPKITADQKTLIKILDNTRATYAFFAKKVVLVEGDSDRYFFRAIFQELKPELNQEIAILDIGGKMSYDKWQQFFVEFGLEVFYIGDSDNIFSLKHGGSTIVSASEKLAAEDNLRQRNLDALSPAEKLTLVGYYQNLIADKNFLQNPKALLWKPFVEYIKRYLKLDNREMVPEIRKTRLDLDIKIEALYASRIFILKNGTLEKYIGTSSKTLDAVIEFCENLKVWLSTSNTFSDEIKEIVNRIST